MGADPEAQASDEPESSKDEPSVKKSPTRRRPRPAKIKTLPMTDSAELLFEKMKEKLSEPVRAAAQIEVNRRSATQIDTPDLQAGYDQIVNPSRRQKAVGIITDFAIAFGSALIGYAGNIYYGGPTDRSPGHIALLAGTFLLTTGIFLKYSPAAG